MKWMVRLKAVMVTIYDDQCDQGDQNNDLIDPILLSRPARGYDFYLFWELRYDPTSQCVDLAVASCHCSSSVQSIVRYLADSNM